MLTSWADVVAGKEQCKLPAGWRGDPPPHPPACSPPDCFYCQVEARANPALRGKPVAVMQYNPWEAGGRVTTRGAQDERIDNASNGSLIAVSYEVRIRPGHHQSCAPRVGRACCMPSFERRCGSGIRAVQL